MRKKLMASAAVLALLMNSPQVKAEDEIVVFGGEFEEEATSKKVEKPAPRKELPPEEKPFENPEPSEPEVVEPQDSPQVQPLESAEPVQIEPQDSPQLQPLESEQPAQIEPQDSPQVQPFENEQPVQIEPQDSPQVQPLENEQPAQIEPQDSPQLQPLESEQPAQIQPEDDNNLGDTLIFDDLNNAPEQKPLNQVEEPFQQTEYEISSEQPTEISNEWQERFEEPIAIVPPPIPVATVEEKPARKISAPRKTQPQKELKMLKPRFIKLAVDDTYTYYLDKSAVEWKKMPYSSSEYMADVWIRMIEREAAPLDEDMAAYGADNFKAQIELAREQGYQYPPEDIKVLSQQAYVLEHYYLRPKTKQVQFLCELEVFGRPQNTINERTYDYKNWENLVPGSVESTIYEAAIKILGKSKSSERGHMTFFDMLDEYARIALN